MEAIDIVIPLISSAITAMVVVGVFVISQAIKYGGLSNEVKTHSEQLRDYPQLRERLAAVESRVGQLGEELQRKTDR